MVGIAVSGARLITALMAGLMALPARADVADVVNDVIAPAYADLAAAAGALNQQAAADCAPDSLRPGFNAVWDDWARIDFLRLGPVEVDGRVLAMHFWPDTKSSGARAQQALIDAGAPAADDPAAFADLSVALRGLAGLERLIYPSPLTGDEAVLCDLRRATASDLAAMTAAISAEWPGYAAALTQPGGPGNTSFLTETEARQAIYTQLVTGLTQLAETRLGRPLGSFDKPRPERAESVLSGRGLRNVTLSLTGIRDAATALAPEAKATGTALDGAIAMAESLDDPALAGVADPASRLKIEILAQTIFAARDTLQAEIGGALGLSVGFNAADGD